MLMLRTFETMECNPYFHVILTDPKLHFPPNEFSLNVCFSDLEGERSVFMGVLDHAAGGGEEHPSSWTQRESPSALHVCLPPGFPQFPPAGGFSFQPQVPRRAARESPLSAHFPFQLSCLVLSASGLPLRDRLLCRITYCPTWALCLHPCPSLQIFSTALLGIFAFSALRWVKGNKRQWNKETCVWAVLSVGHHGWERCWTSPWRFWPCLIVRSGGNECTLVEVQLSESMLTLCSDRCWTALRCCYMRTPDLTATHQGSVSPPLLRK